MTAFSMSAVLSRTFSIIGRSLSSVGVLIIGTQVIMAAVQFGLMKPMMASAMANPAAPGGFFTSGAYWLSLVISLALFSVVIGGAIYGAIETAEGRRADLGDCVRTGVAKALPVLGLTVLWMLGVWVGFMLLVVPGLILMTMWSVALPVLVAGEATVMGSFGRSRALTKGARWKILGLLVLFMVVYYALYMAVLAPAMMPAQPGANPAAVFASMSSTLMAGSLIVSTVMLFILPALMTSIFVETRKGHITAHGETVEQVFA